VVVVGLLLAVGFLLKRADRQKERQHHGH